MNPFVQEQSDVKTPSFATVAAIDGAGRVTLTFPVSGETSTKYYPRLASYSPTVGDRVYIVPVSGTYLVIGEVV